MIKFLFTTMGIEDDELVTKTFQAMDVDGDNVLCCLLLWFIVYCLYMYNTYIQYNIYIYIYILCLCM